MNKLYTTKLKINYYEAELLASALKDAIEADQKKPWFETQDKQITQMQILLQSLEGLFSGLLK